MKIDIVDFIHCGMDYHVSSFEGHVAQVKDLLTALAKDVNSKLIAGYSLVGGVSICSHGYDTDCVIVSQAMTIVR